MTKFYYPSNIIDTDKNPAYMMFDFYERTAIRKLDKTDTIYLAMPESVSNPSTVSWDAEKVGFLAGYLNKHANEAMQIRDMNSAMSFMAQAASDSATKVLTHAAANYGAKGLGFLGSNVSADDLLGMTTGQVSNPFLTMLFRGVDFRSFSYVFKFTPKSEDDCVEIINIVRKFRYHSLPNKTNKEGNFLGYPSEVDLGYYWRGERNTWLPEFKRCVITAIDDDYTPSDMFSTKRNGYPTQINMAVKFTEITINTREDIKFQDYEAFN